MHNQKRLIQLVMINRKQKKTTKKDLAKYDKAKAKYDAKVAEKQQRIK